MLPPDLLKSVSETIKTSTGGITRTVTRVAGKGGTANADKDTGKAQTGSRAGTAKGTKKNDGQVVKCPTLPASTLEASNAMIAAASKVQNKWPCKPDKNESLCHSSEHHESHHFTSPRQPSVG